MTLDVLIAIASILFLVGTFVLLLALMKIKSLQNKIKELEQLEYNFILNERIERNHIGNLLHDELQGDLIAIKNYLFIFNKLNHINDRTPVLLNIQSSIDKALIDTKKLSDNFKPPLLSKEEFTPLLQNYFKNLNESTGKNFSFELDDNGFALPPNKVYGLFRILQLLCLYVSIHSEIKSLFVKLSQTSNSQMIELLIDGAFTDLKNMNQASIELLLENIKFRLNILNAQLVQPQIINGNHLTIKIDN